MIDPVDLLFGAVSIPSVSGSESAVARYLADRMARLPGRAGVDEAGNAVCVLGNGPLRVTFLGHIDTVGGEVPVRIEEGRLYGRGSVDAKGPFCAAVAAASRVDPGVLGLLTLTLIGAVGEESPGSPGARHALEAYERPDLLIVGEPSGWDGITLGYKGRLVVKLNVSKPDHHSASGETSAADDAVDAWNSVRSWAEERNRGRERIFDRIQATLQSIASDGDGLEQRCSAVVGLRLPPWLSTAEARSQLEDLLPEAARPSFAGSEEPVLASRETVLARVFRNAIRRHGGRPRHKVKTGTSDMNVVAGRWDVPMLAYGPGDSSLDHTPREHVEVAHLQKASDILATVFDLLADAGSQSPESS